MAKSKTSPAHSSAADTPEAVDRFMASLKHPHKAAIEALRKIIRGADPSIAEGVKWNAPSFRTTEYFATTHLRAKSGIGVILHLGAKVREAPQLAIEDPEGRLEWLGKDRARLGFSGVEDVEARASALRGIVRQWIRYV